MCWLEWSPECTMKGILSAISFSTMAWHGPSIRMMSTTTMEYVDFILRRTLDKVRRFPAAGLYRLLAARGEIFRKNDECDQPPTRLPVSCDKSRNDPEYDMPTPTTPQLLSIGGRRSKKMVGWPQSINRPQCQRCCLGATVGWSSMRISRPQRFLKSSASKMNSRAG